MKRGKKEKKIYVLKGLFFEAVIRELIKKAGFNKEFESDEKTPRRFYGRGAKHQIDVWGEFCFSIPFIYPLNILGEAKARKYIYPANLRDVRNFTAAVMDIRQWYRINLKSNKLDRYLPVTKLRHLHCPVFFSYSGFTKEAEQFMYAHGIYPVTYENNPAIGKIYRLFNRVINQIDYRKRISGKHIGLFRNLQDIRDFPDEIKTAEFDKAYKKLVTKLTNLNSHFGMLGGRYLINIIGKKFTEKSRRTVRLKFKNGTFRIGDGYFSLSRHFLRYYLYNIYQTREVFSEIDLILLEDDFKNATLIKLKIDKGCLIELQKDIKNYLERISKKQNGK